jgi:hypothetical protein
MTARVMKDQIKKTLRDTMRRVRVPSEEPYRLQILNYLNEIFVRNLKSFWSTEVKDLLKRKFNYDIPLSFCNGSLLDVVDTNDLLMRFQQLSGVKLTRGAVALLLLGTSELYVFLLPTHSPLLLTFCFNFKNWERRCAEGYS